MKIKHINTNPFKDFSGNTLTWNISLILISYNSYKKNQFQIDSLTKKLFRLNIFAMYFPLKLIFFTHRPYLYKAKVIFAFMKRIDVEHFCHKCAIEYWLLASFSSHKLFIALFEFNRINRWNSLLLKPFLTACY